MTEPASLRVRHLTHRYGALEVVKDVSFDVRPGEIYGFIGPNGAGKTTTIRIMATLLEPTAGRVWVEGIDVALEPERARRVLGYMADHAGVYERVTLREYLDFFARAYRVPSRDVVDAVLELTDLAPLANRTVSVLSKGMRQRLQLARVLLHDPSVLLLDEPASDLDPRARIEIRDLLLELRELGKTILLSSHILTELADVCTSVGILERGRMVVTGPIGEIAARLEEARGAPAREAAATAAVGTTSGGAPIPPRARRRLKLRVLGPGAPVAAMLSGGPGVVEVAASHDQVMVTYEGDDRLVAEMVRWLVGSGVMLVGIEPERTELERIFLESTRGDLA